MKTVIPRFQVRHLGRRGTYTVLDNRTGEICGTMGQPAHKLSRVSRFAALLNATLSAYLGAGTASEENYQE